jgi:hypothetical protein
MDNDNVKRGVGRPRKEPQLAIDKRGVGRPPNHAPVNRYTGIRAQNIDYVRQFLRRWLEAEERGEHKLSWDGGERRVMSVHYRTVLIAVRALLACEEIYIFETSTPAAKVDKTRQGLLALGESIKDGSTKLPDLLLQLRELGVKDDDD